jgi:hypothetical protein
MDDRESEEKREPASDINSVAVDSLKVLDPNRPIREADISVRGPATMSVQTGESKRRRYCRGEKQKDRLGVGADCDV